MNRVAESGYISQVKKSRWITTLFVIVIFFFGTLFALKGNTGSVTAQVNESLLGVIGTYGDTTFIKLDEINEFLLVDVIEKGEKVEGEETDNTCSGVYKNEEFGEYTLHAYMDLAPYIVVHYGEGETLVFNQGRERLTRSLYEDLQEACGN